MSFHGAHQGRLVLPNRAPQLPSDLDGRLVRLGPAVGEERLLHAGQPAERLRQLRLLGDMVQVAHVDQTGGLSLDGLDHPGVAMSHRVYRDPRQKVEIPPAVRAPEIGPLAPLERDREAGVGGHHSLPVGFLRGFQTGLFESRLLHGLPFPRVKP